MSNFAREQQRLRLLQQLKELQKQINDSDKLLQNVDKSLTHNYNELAEKLQSIRADAEKMADEADAILDSVKSADEKFEEFRKFFNDTKYKIGEVVTAQKTLLQYFSELEKRVDELENGVDSKFFYYTTLILIGNIAIFILLYSQIKG